jgi:hypothetical protein
LTGRQIARNLRKSKRKWGTESLYNEGFYCVLGIKAAEKGVTPAVLEWFDDNNNDTLAFRDEVVSVPDYSVFNELETLTRLNDKADSKQDLIDELETAYRDVEFAVEAFVKYLKSVQKKRLHLKKETE